ncbi:MAG TPA: hypothetical protein VGO07_05780 [Candidatus Saccharimonadales bacterium]|nr:hypothetical protein [Candidatus Saccharimonadales bacterium]
MEHADAIEGSGAASLEAAAKITAQQEAADAYRALQVQGSLAMRQVAESNDIKWVVSDVTEKLGHEQSPWYRRHSKQDKRWDEIVGVQETAARHENDEFDCGRRLAVWLEDELSLQERATLRMRPVDYIDDYGLTPMQFVTNHDGREKTFQLGQSFNFHQPGPVSDKASLQDQHEPSRPGLSLLPEEIQTFLQQKRDYWTTLGVHNGGELDAFVDEYFTFTEIDLDKGKLPAELEWLFASLPGAEDVLREDILDRHGVVRLRQLKGTPPAVLEHIHAVSQSQNKLISWLKPFVTEGIEPIIHESDNAKIEAERQKERSRLERNTKLGAFRRELLEAREDEKAAEQRDFNDSLLGITNFAEIAYGIETSIPDGLTAGERDNLSVNIGDMNKHLDDEFGGGAALEHMLRDVNGRHSEGILKTLKLAAGLIVAGETLHLIYEQHPEWTPLAVAVFLLALMEDPVSEGGEALSQRSLGWSWAEIAPRYKLIGPVAIGSVAAGLTVKWVGDNYGESLAAVDFAIAGCATTGATLFKTIQSSHRAHRAQVAEGKVQGHINLDKAGQAEVLAALVNTDSHEGAMASVREIINAQTNEEVSEADLKVLYGAIEQALMDGDIDAAMSRVSVPFRQALKAAWDESFGINPARKGKLAGMALMLGSAPVPFVAHLVFTQAIATMMFSMGEPLSGIATNYIHKFLDAPRRATRARKEAARLRAAQVVGDISA